MYCLSPCIPAASGGRQPLTARCTASLGVDSTCTCGGAVGGGRVEWVGQHGTASTFAQHGTAPLDGGASREGEQHWGWPERFYLAATQVFHARKQPQLLCVLTSHPDEPNGGSTTGSTTLTSLSPTADSGTPPTVASPPNMSLPPGPLPSPPSHSRQPTSVSTTVSLLGSSAGRWRASVPRNTTTPSRTRS